MKRGVAPGGFMLLAAAGLFVSLARVEARSFGRATQPREAFIADPEVIPYCNLPAGARARIPPLKPPHDLHGLKLLQVRNDSCLFLWSLLQRFDSDRACFLDGAGPGGGEARVASAPHGVRPHLLDGLRLQMGLQYDRGRQAAAILGM